jgi:hypothetical protein
MGYLDWIKRHGQSPEKEANDAGRKPMNGLFAEWRQDYQLGKHRDETGREPASRPLEKAREPKPETKKPPAGRERVKGHDIPF